MDIRSFFQKKDGAATAAKPAGGKKQTTTKAASPSTRKAPARQAAKKVVVLDDSEEDEDMDKDEVEVEVAKPQPRKRIRRAVASEDEDEDDDVLDVTPPKPTTSSSVKPAAPVATTKPAMVKLNVSAEDDDQDEDSAPIQIKQSGKAPPPCAGCLDGKTFVFTGVLHSITRDAAIHLVKQCGGSVATNVSRNTKYLVIGDKLENGNDVTSGVKYRDAMEKNVRVLRQNEFYNLITELAAAKEVGNLRKEKAAAKSAANKPPSTNGKVKLTTTPGSDALWTDKYKPKTLDHMIGNIELGRKLKQWLLDWDAVHVKHTKKIPFTTKLAENRGAKTVLLSGPPGIGKTTIATLVAKECGFECTELNASDTRSKKMLQTGLKDVLGTQAIQFGPAKARLSKRVVIMDEVDGMSGGDRGGTAELIQLIKNSKTPIICICNDRQSTKVRSLANHSFDLRMRRPTKQQISKRLMEIGLLEGLTMEKNAIEEAADRCGNDIRQLITQMQRWRMTTTNITYDDMVNPSSQHNKDESLRLNPFSATQLIFQRESSFEARNEAYFVDYDLMPLMVQENYIRSVMSHYDKSGDNLQAICNAADFIAESDIANTYVRMQQRWDLLTTQAALNVAAAINATGFIGNAEFSRWLGKNSTASKSKRLLSELSVRMRAHASGSREVIRMDYVPFMKEILLTKLLAGEEHINDVIDLLDSCEISREDLTESMESFKLPGIKRHTYSELDTKAKTAFTRLYNKASHKSQGVVERELQATTVKKGRGRAAAAVEEDGLPPPSDAESEAEDGDDVDVSKFQKKPRGRAPAKAKSEDGPAKGKRKAPAKATAASKKRKS
ncbi:hypothetical protein Poli38472_011094 [Pythium oligandrum]|uniref:Replication factor C subunit 1 n=1 Tax=Pythium oligandrum TaxID=41045 RepID=A0A8K1CQN2_PYTOL|nr:hypothetical protein Poli38472_011094 [Pythium oligandrum]|eukprot:TMW67474.1 hypothetical protein Poli38472_011094 [Pythium oligandrum]